MAEDTHKAAASDAPPEDSAKNARVLWGVVLSGVVAELALFWGHRVDDAYISFRYASNLLRHGELVYNLGERVEGYSNLLWTLLCVPGALWTDPSSYARGVGVLLLLISLLTIHRLVRQLTPDMPELAPLAVALSLAAPGWVYWQVAGLEVPLVGALLLLGLWLEWSPDRRRARLSFVVWGLLLLARVDAIVMLIPALAVPALLEPRRERVMRSLTTGLGAAALGALQLSLRRVYYGEWLPNTYYAKLGMTSAHWEAGLEYAASPLWHAPLLVLVVLVPFACLRRQTAAERFVLTGVAVTLAQVAYVARIGGDWMPLYRLMAPVLPLAALCVVMGLAQRLRRRRDYTPSAQRLASLVLALIAPLFGFGSYWVSPAPLDVIQASEVAHLGELMGKALSRERPPIRDMGNGTAGAAPFFSALPNLDIHGLTDAHIARRPVSPLASSFLGAGHLKGDGDYVLRRAPEVLVFVLGRGDTPGPYASDTQIVFHPRFHADYQQQRLSVTRPMERAGRFGGSAALAERLVWFGELELRPGALGDELWRRPSVELTYFRRATGERPPARAAMHVIAGALEGGDPARALALLGESRETLRQAGLSHLVHPMAARFALMAGNEPLARRHLDAAQSLLDPVWRRLFLAWIRLDPIFRGLVTQAMVAAGPSGAP